MATSSILKDYHATPEEFEWLVNFIDENYVYEPPNEKDKALVEDGIRLLEEFVKKQKG